MLTQRIARLALLLLCVGLLSHSGVTPRVAAQGGGFTIYLPLITRTGCAPNAQETDIANRMKTHPQQQRPTLNCDHILEKVARERAQDMGVRAYFNHVNPDGLGPNYLVEQAGYILPNWYSQALNANNIESIAAGYGTAETAWTGWMNSSGHATHLLGLNSFWAEQIDYGIGYVYVPGSPYGHYWVVITAKRGP
ncbi:MAG: hypothetical protein JNL09_06050 [Anaerolineales bacterium]|nr:hypothetical protein [Anaerolineales bacterium]